MIVVRGRPLSVLAFNRTSLELKQCRAAPIHIGVELLIEPVWNWNHHHRRRHFYKSQAFNRTSLELKRAFLRCVYLSRRCLLIEPVWNWNIFSKSGQIDAWTFNRTSLELKRVLLCLSRVLWAPFNRTSLELKPDHIFRGLFNAGLLIEPVWNWNRFLQVQMQ